MISLPPRLLPTATHGALNVRENLDVEVREQDVEEEGGEVKEMREGKSSNG